MWTQRQGFGIFGVLVFALCGGYLLDPWKWIFTVVSSARERRQHLVMEPGYGQGRRRFAQDLSKRAVANFPKEEPEDEFEEEHKEEFAVVRQGIGSAIFPNFPKEEPGDEFEEEHKEDFAVVRQGTGSANVPKEEHGDEFEVLSLRMCNLNEAYSFFEMCDLNGKGKLDPVEVEAFHIGLTKADKGPSGGPGDGVLYESELKTMMSAIDADGNGKVTKAEAEGLWGYMSYDHKLWPPPPEDG